MTLNSQKNAGKTSGSSEGGKKRYETLLDRILAFLKHIRRFGWDLLGIFLILLGLLSILGLTGITRGTLIDPWIIILKQNFGWGSYLLFAAIGLLGISAIRHRTGKQPWLSFGQVFALEGIFFTLIALFAIFGGLSLDRAVQGMDGGTLGWGLARLFPGVFSTAIYLLLFILFLGYGSGLFAKLVTKAREWNSSATNEAVRARMMDGNHLNQDQHHRRRTTAKSDQNQGTAKTNWRDDRLPPMNLLLGDQASRPDETLIKAKAQIIEKTLAEFGIPVKVIGFRVGPSVTQFALEPGFMERQNPDGELSRQKVRVAQISHLRKDLALALSASRLRIETPVPGRSYVGIEVPNADSTMVRLRSVLESNEFKKIGSPLAIGLGRNVSGDVVATDLEKMPHLLIAGTTNSGKSVCITAITASLVMNNTPNDLKLVMLDPKMVELVRFNGLPHLLGKVETEIERMLAVLRWAQAEMDSRYRTLAEMKVRNLEAYNQKMRQKKQKTLPRIVILIDELADLMMSAPEQTEHSLIRLAQMARATGIHLIVATQRPSTDVVTGLIKANFPSRISFAVASSIDSRVVLDSSGAEDLLGKGDMLFLDPQRSGLQRLQGILINDMEIEKILNHWQKMSNLTTNEPPPWEELVETGAIEESDQLIEKAIAVVKGAGKASASLLQRRLRVGYPRAARLMDELEEMGVVGPAVGSGKDRDVLIQDDESTEAYSDER